MCISQALIIDRADKSRLLTSVQVEQEIILFKKYNNYTDVFSEEEMSQLCNNTKISHAIDIEKDKKSLYKLIYSLSVKEL